MDITNTQTSLISIATLFAVAAGATFDKDVLWGSILAILAVAVLVLRGYLTKKGIVEASAQK